MKAVAHVVAALAAVYAISSHAQDDDLDFGVEDDEISAIVETADEDGDSFDADSAASSFSSEESDAGESKDGKKKSAAPAKLFSPLPYCSKLSGKGEYLKPGSSEWLPIEEKKYYPFGSSFRITDSQSKLSINFSPAGCASNDMKTVTLSMGKASFGTRVQPIDNKTREIFLQEGVITLRLPQNQPDDTFKVSSPCFTVTNLKGESRYAYTANGDGEAAQIRCVSGSLAIVGRHFSFPGLKPSNEIKIRSSQDQLFTGLYGSRGDCEVVLDQGMQRVIDSSSGEDVETVEKKTLKWKLAPRTAVRIHRAMPAIGSRMSVTVMTFDGRGALKNRCAFSEGRHEVNTGELAPLAIEELTALARKNSQQPLETEEVEISEEEMGEEESGSEESSADDSSGGDSSGGGDDFDDDMGF